jgi:CBS domain-containing protein
MTTIEQLMSTPVVTATEGEALAGVIERMHDRRVG